MGRSRSHSRPRRSSSRSKRQKHHYRSSEISSHKSTRRRARYSRSSSKTSENSSSDRRSSSQSNSSSRSISRSPIRNIKTNSTNATAANKIKLQKTPSPPPAPSFSMNCLDERQVTDALDELNADEFVPKTFKSEASSTKIKTEITIAGNIVKNYSGTPNEDPLFHQNVSEIHKYRQFCFHKK